MCIRDSLITSSNWEEHCNRVEHVLDKLPENNITLKLEKSNFIADEVQFLGFDLNAQGISPSQEKVDAIRKFPTPKNRKQLQSFLGICNYYRKFQENYSVLMAKFQHHDRRYTPPCRQRTWPTWCPVSYTHLLLAAKLS